MKDLLLCYASAPEARQRIRVVLDGLDLFPCPVEVCFYCLKNLDGIAVGFPNLAGFVHAE